MSQTLLVKQARTQQALRAKVQRQWTAFLRQRNVRAFLREGSLEARLGLLSNSSHLGPTGFHFR